MTLAFRRSFLCGVTLAAIGCLCWPLGGVLRADDPSPAPAPVPLGSNPQQIAKLYGPVLRHNARVRHHEILEGGSAMDGDLYSRNGLVVRVVYHAEAAVLLEYTRVEGVLTAHDVTLLLAANADLSTWETGKDSTDTNRFYHRADGKAIAHYSTEYDGSLLISAERTGNDFYRDKLIEEGH